MSADPYIVFVSHSSADTWVAKQIARRIEEIGGDVFLDAVDIDKGDDFDAAIKDALQRCRELIVLMTKAASESRNVWMEIGAMWYAGKRVVGILYGMSMDNVRADVRMPQGFKKLHLVDLNDMDECLDEFADRIEKAIRA